MLRHVLTDDDAEHYDDKSLKQRVVMLLAELRATGQLNSIITIGSSMAAM